MENTVSGRLSWCNDRNETLRRPLTAVTAANSLLPLGRSCPLAHPCMQLPPCLPASWPPHVPTTGKEDPGRPLQHTRWDSCAPHTHTHAGDTHGLRSRSRVLHGYPVSTPHSHGKCQDYISAGGPATLSHASQVWVPKTPWEAAWPLRPSVTF